MPLVSTPAIILHAFPYSETSRILRLLTQTHGVQSVIAKGAQRPKSRFAGLLQLFTEGTATFSFRETHDLHTLTGFDLLRSRHALADDLVRFGAAAVLAEIIVRVAAEQTDPDLYDRVNEALDHIAAAAPDRVEPTALAQLWSLIATLGFAPSLDACLNCGRGIDSQEEGMLDYTAGGVRCHDCSPGTAGRLIPAAARQALMHLVAGLPVPLERTAAHWRLLDRYLAHHVLEGHELRAMEFLRGALGQGG